MLVACLPVVTESPFWQLEFIIYSPFARPPEAVEGTLLQEKPKYVVPLQDDRPPTSQWR